MGYEIVFLMELDAPRTWCEVRRRGQFVCRTKSYRMAERIVKALEAAG